MIIIDNHCAFWSIRPAIPITSGQDSGTSGKRAALFRACGKMSAQHSVWWTMCHGSG